MTKITVKNQTEPSTPSATRSIIWVDDVTKRLKSKDDAGNIYDYASEGGLPEAPIDGKQYARKDAAWEEVDAEKQSLITIGTTAPVTPVLNMLWIDIS